MRSQPGLFVEGRMPEQKPTEALLDPCENPLIDRGFLAQVFAYYQGSDGPFYVALWRGKAYRMVLDED
jgi:hypothetical protein